jgi:hypothetical protein
MDRSLDIRNNIVDSGHPPAEMYSTCIGLHPKCTPYLLVGASPAFLNVLNMDRAEPSSKKCFQYIWHAFIPHFSVSSISYSCCEQNEMHVGVLNCTPVVIFCAVPDYKINEEGPHYLWPLECVYTNKKKTARTKKNVPTDHPCLWRFVEDSETAERPRLFEAVFSVVAVISSESSSGTGEPGTGESGDSGATDGARTGRVMIGGRDRPGLRGGTDGRAGIVPIVVF